MDEKMKKAAHSHQHRQRHRQEQVFRRSHGHRLQQRSLPEPTAENIEYFVERAKGGFGAIFTGCMIPDNVTSDKVAGKSMLNNPNAARLAFTALTGASPPTTPSSLPSSPSAQAGTTRQCSRPLPLKLTSIPCSRASR